LAIEGLEGPLELIPDESSTEGLKAYRPPKRTVFANCSVYVGRIALKLCLAEHSLALNGELDDGSLASLTGRHRETGPFAVIRTDGSGTTELR